jgi:glycosyltransferase involved in cell wall biosynthesis
MNTGKKPEIVFILPDILGGVSSFNRNIINNASLREKAYVRVILLRELPWQHATITEAFDADEVVSFQYSSHENRHAILKRLSEALGTAPGAVFCNEGLAMECVYQCGTNKTVYQFIHDFYNMRLAVIYGGITDVFISHTRLFVDVLISADPPNVRAFHLPHGVAIPKDLPPSVPGNALKVVFTGRLVEDKGVQDLYAINQLLRDSGVMAEWTIIGRGPLKKHLEEQWTGEANIRFASPDSTGEVMQMMGANDIFILPTRFEGSPVTILEALSTGLVPVVSDLPGGIREIVTEDIGRTIPIGDNRGFAAAIANLHRDRDQLMKMKAAARNLAQEQFDIKVTSDRYFDLLLRYASLKKEPGTLNPVPVGFRLDQKWLPNVLVSFLRKGFPVMK